MPVYFIRSDQIVQHQVQLDKTLQHHLRNVLRLKVGETIRLVDEGPKCYEARVIASHPNPIALEIESETLPPSGTLPTIRLAVALLKKEKMDWLVQKATELGVSRLTPLISTRTVVRPDPKRTLHQHERWQKIALEAAQQSCRWHVPSIDAPLSLEAVLSEAPAEETFRFICSERHAPDSCKAAIQERLSAGKPDGTILIGPEGGWTTAELNQADAAGFHAISLGERVLRTETAALAILSILQYEILNGSSQPRIT